MLRRRAHKALSLGRNTFAVDRCWQEESFLGRLPMLQWIVNSQERVYGQCKLALLSYRYIRSCEVWKDVDDRDKGIESEG